MQLLSYHFSRTNQTLSTSARSGFRFSNYPFPFKENASIRPCELDAADARTALRYVFSHDHVAGGKGSPMHWQGRGWNLGCGEEASKLDQRATELRCVLKFMSAE